MGGGRRRMAIVASSIAATVARGFTTNVVRVSQKRAITGSHVHYHRRGDTSSRLYSGGRYRCRKAGSVDDTGATSALDWERFEFSTSPKWDKRFESSSQGGTFFPNEDFDAVIVAEAEQDRIVAQKLDEINTAYQSLSPTLVSSATKVLRPYINPDRLHRIETVLGQRTKRSRFLFENPSNPSNVWACLRTIDSFGVQNVDVVIDSGRYKGKAAVSQKRGMRTAMGSAQWLTLRNHPSTAHAVNDIKSKGYKIYASDLNPTSRDVRDLDWNSGPVCVVMGNENDGITEEMRSLADETFTLPMCGFAESFNLSVATAITLAHMSAASKGGDEGPLRPGDLDEHEVNCLRLKGLLNSLPQRRMGGALLRKEGIELPSTISLL